MPRLARVAQREVTFIRPDGDMMIRMMEPTTRSICEAAQALKASHFVTADDFCIATDLPIWGVFEMRTAQKDTPYPGEWSINDPVRTFTAATSDAAVMWAMHTRAAS